MRGSSAICNSRAGLPISTTTGQVYPAARITISSAVVALSPCRITGLTRRAGRYSIPTGAACIADLQYTAGTAILIDVADRFVARSPRSRDYTERTGGAGYRRLPLGNVVDDYAFLDVGLSADGITPSRNGRTCPKTTGRRGQVANLTCCAGVYRGPNAGRSIALFADVARTSIRAGSQALRRVASAIGRVTKRRSNAGRLWGPIDEIGGTDA